MKKRGSEKSEGRTLKEKRGRERHRRSEVLSVDGINVCDVFRRRKRGARIKLARGRCELKKKRKKRKEKEDIEQTKSKGKVNSLIKTT